MEEKTADVRPEPAACTSRHVKAKEEHKLIIDEIPFYDGTKEAEEQAISVEREMCDSSQNTVDQDSVMQNTSNLISKPQSCVRKDEAVSDFEQLKTSQSEEHPDASVAKSSQKSDTDRSNRNCITDDGNENHTEHIATDPKITHKCSDCDYQTGSQIELAIHVNSAHIVWSDICKDYSSTNISEVKHHMGQCCGEKMYDCGVCGFKLTKKALQSHMARHEGKHVCSECGFKTKHKGNLKNHMWIHTGEKPFPCNECDYRAVTTSALSSHMKSHTGEKPHQCDRCDYRSATNYQLRAHMRVHTGTKTLTTKTLPKLKPYYCDKCDYRCASKARLADHETTHSQDRPFACNECEYRTANKKLLRKHVINKHVEGLEKPHACGKCDYKSRLKANLNIHLRTHTKEKPYPCTVCDYRGRTSGRLKAHMLVHAPTGQAYRCTLCDYKTFRYMNLCQHSKSHFDERPHACGLCDYKGKLPTHLKQHMATHTGKKR